MAQPIFSLPKQWEDWTSLILGIWLLLSPWALFFDQDTLAMENAVVIGVIIIFTENVELSIFRDWEEWINVACGLWLVASPWVLGIASSVAKWDFVIVGVLVLALALYELRGMRAGTSS